ncbi:MAG: hypothetical protein A2Z02_02645 [Chloroflexi bacterium RBG_16_48_7]|nr:MAG: hypothetical protein A2Z02_02645 [Chloroflexi bacterium RBG_16_48_7]
MIETKREIKTEEQGLLEFIVRLAEGKYMIPSFQRYFVWEPESIIKLWDSIYHFYPLGSILYWKTDIRLSIHRKMGGFVIPRDTVKTPEQKERAYVLDGQQRATSLVISYVGGKGRVRNTENFDFTTYFDATTATFFFENELNRRKWDIDPAFLVKLQDVTSYKEEDAVRLSLVPGFTPAIARHLRQLKHSLENYKITLIRITGFDVAGVCEIYERINQAGRKLENMDIMIARSFQDNPTIIEET